MKITKIDAPFAIDVKRLYLPFVIEDDCPECGRMCVFDLTGDYLSYPTIDGVFLASFYCEEGHDVEEWDQELVLKVSVEALPEV